MLLLLSCQAFATRSASAAPSQRWAVELGAEHLWPTHAGRHITTNSLNALVGHAAFDSCWLAWRAGVTATYASGYIVQWGDNFQDARFDSNAFGIGPTGIVRIQTPELLHLVLSFEGSGALVLYDHQFPAGGDVYNFMWRAGPSLSYRFDESWSAGAGARVMHVSNGQGLTPKNPSYEARGLTVWLSWAL